MPNISTTYRSDPDACSYILLAISIAICLLWLLFKYIGIPLPGSVQLALPAVTVLGAGFIITCSAVYLGRCFSRRLGISFIALVAALPIYVMGWYLSWIADQEPAYAELAISSIIGANVLLLGLGWALLVAINWLRTRNVHILIWVKCRVDMLGLLLAGIYLFIVWMKRSLGLIDALVFLIIFLFYIRTAIHWGKGATDDDGGGLCFNRTSWYKHIIILSFFALAVWSLCTATAPLVKTALYLAGVSGVGTPAIFNWGIPLVCELPLIVTAAILACRFKPDIGLDILISSKVNHITVLLVIIWSSLSISTGALGASFSPPTHSGEVFLASTQTLFALIAIMDLKFTWQRALFLFALFLIQMFVEIHIVRYIIGILFIVYAAILVSGSRIMKSGLKHTLRVAWKAPHREAVIEPSQDS